MKTCSYCKETLPEDMFWKDKRNKDGLQGLCKICLGNKIKAYQKTPKGREQNRIAGRRWASQNKEKIKLRKRKRYYENPEQARKAMLQRYHKNPEPYRIRWQRWYAKNKEKHIANAKNYYQAHREIIIKNQIENYQKRIQNDPSFRIKERLRKRMQKALANTIKNESSVALLGCLPQELKTHLESQWQLGMSWENYGHKGWHVDHVRPCASFDLTDSCQQKECFHWTNLQPLWAKDNLKKGKYITSQVRNGGKSIISQKSIGRR